MSLREYQRKRSFQKTPEPRGTERAATGHRFVVQKHAASRLHYDFRLEMDGVLKSWAVPKGPCLDPSVKRLAIQVEDHPVEYGDFEGIIPEGEYGGGTVLLWDEGEWEPLGDAEEDYRNGKLKFQLRGEKLGGGWMLVRTGRSGADGSRPQWLLFKERDDEARPLSDVDILEDMPLSVTTGRNLPDIAADGDRVLGEEPKKKAVKARVRRRSANAEPEYDAAKKQFAGVRLTSPEKILYADQGITKLELANYYRGVASWMLPHVVDRPLVLVRCPEGQDKKCFFQKHPRPGTPDGFRLVPITENEKTENYVAADDSLALISLAQISALEVHAWGSRIDNLERPDRLIFDLDPDPRLPWDRVAASARQIREFLEQLGLESFVKTTGGKGLHLVVPIEPSHDWDDAKAFCERVATAIVRADPRHYTANMAKAARSGKIYIDHLRNGRGATAIVPYSPRARPGAAVSVPLTWKELSPRIPSDHFTIRNVMKRLRSLKRDPWATIGSVEQSLDGPIEKLRRVFPG